MSSSILTGSSLSVQFLPLCSPVQEGVAPLLVKVEEATSGLSAILVIHTFFSLPGIEKLPPRGTSFLLAAPSVTSSLPHESSGIPPRPTHELPPLGVSRLLTFIVKPYNIRLLCSCAILLYFNITFIVKPYNIRLLCSYAILLYFNITAICKICNNAL